MFDIVLAVAFGIFGAFFGLSIVDPERAFRYENLFQIRTVELSEFGKLLQVGGGVLCVLAGPFIAASIVGRIGAIFFIGGVVAIIGHYKIGKGATESDKI